MKYMLLIHSNPEAWAKLSTADQEAMMAGYWTFTEKIQASGELVAGDPLEGPDTATTVRVRGGSRATTDGPFVETKEHLAGYYVVDCVDLDRAIALAAEIPDAATGGVEVRPIADMGPTA